MASARPAMKTAWAQPSMLKVELPLHIGLKTSEEITNSAEDLSLTEMEWVELRPSS